MTVRGCIFYIKEKVNLLLYLFEHEAAYLLVLVTGELVEYQ